MKKWIINFFAFFNNIYKKLLNQQRKEAISEALKDKPKTEEHKAKISLSKKGKKRKPFSKATKRKMKLAQKLRRLKEKRLKVNGTE